MVSVFTRKTHPRFRPEDGETSVESEWDQKTPTPTHVHVAWCAKYKSLRGSIGQHSLLHVFTYDYPLCTWVGKKPFSTIEMISCLICFCRKHRIRCAFSWRIQILQTEQVPVPHTPKETLRVMPNTYVNKQNSLMKVSSWEHSELWVYCV